MPASTPASTPGLPPSCPWCLSDRCLSTPFFPPSFHPLLPACLQNISDEDVLALVNDEVHQPTVVWVLEDLQASAGRRRFDWRGGLLPHACAWRCLRLGEACT